MNMAGAGMSTSVLGAFSLSGGLYLTGQKDEENIRTVKKNEEIGSSVTIEHIQTGKIRIENSKIRLKDEVQSVLREINEVQDVKARRKKIWYDLIQKFGSHVLPTAILGGCSIDTSNYTCTEQVENVNLKTAMNKAYNGFISAGGFVVGSIGMGQVSAAGNVSNTGSSGKVKTYNHAESKV